MHSIHHLFPCIYLLLIVNSRDMRKPRTRRRDDGSLGDEQASLGGPLRVVLRQRRPRQPSDGPAPRHRRQHHPVGEAEAAHLVGREERRPLIRRRPIHLVMWRAGSGQHWGEARKGGEREANCRRELSGTVGFESESHTGNEQRREGLVARTSRHG